MPARLYLGNYGSGQLYPDKFIHTSYLHIEENTECFSSHLSHPSGSCMLEIELPLRHRLWMDDVALSVSLSCFRDADLHIMSVETPHILAARAPGVFNMALRHGVRVRPRNSGSVVLDPIRSLGEE